MEKLEQLVPYLFASVVGLEDKLKTVKNCLPMDNLIRRKSKQNINAIESSVKKMRRTCIKIQLELAKNNRAEAIRLLQVYYGLSQMVKPEVLKSIKQTNQSNVLIIDKFRAAAELH